MLLIMICMYQEVEDIIAAGLNSKLANMLTKYRISLTIRFVTNDDKLLSVTDAKIGNEIMAYMRPPSGRHFGIEVEEYIVEK